MTLRLFLHAAISVNVVIVQWEVVIIQVQNCFQLTHLYLAPRVILISTLIAIRDLKL